PGVGWGYCSSNLSLSTRSLPAHTLGFQLSQVSHPPPPTHTPCPKTGLPPTAGWWCTLPSPASHLPPPHPPHPSQSQVGGRRAPLHPQAHRGVGFWWGYE